MGMDNPECRVLLIDEGLAIGVFRSLEEMYAYVKQGYPAADIGKYKSELLANGSPEDFYKLLRTVQEQWNELPENAKQIIRDNGADILEMHKVEDGEDGEKIFHPNSNFQSKPDEQETEGDEKHLNTSRIQAFNCMPLRTGK